MLIINAGIGSDYDKDISLADNFALRFKTHVFGTFHLTESLLPLINQDGSIINISSKLSSFAEASKIGSHKLTSTKMASIMSKSYLNMYTKLLANRLSGKNIHVLSVHPGWVRTNLSETNKDAPMSIEEAGNGIIKILSEPRPSGTFWDAESQMQLNW